MNQGKKREKKSKPALFEHITVGLQLSATIFIFVYGGYLLDEKNQSSPLWVIVGTVIGMVLGFYQLIKELKTINNRSGDSESEEKNHRTRWM